MAQLYDPYRSCSVCEQPTDNLNLCDDCLDQMGNMLDAYESDVYPTPEPRKPDHDA